MKSFYIDKNFKEIHFITEYDSEFISDVKAIPGRQYDAETKHWYMYMSPDVKDAVKNLIVKHKMNRLPDIEDTALSHDQILSKLNQKNLQRTPRHYQLDNISYLLKHKKCIDGSEMGTGKAQPLTSKILTINGWCLMKDIKVGDLVIGSDGLPHKVLNIYPQGKKNIYEVIFNDKTSTECCDEHLWCVNTQIRNFRKHDYKIKSLREIMNIGLKYKNGNNKHYIPVVNPIEFNEKNLLIDPYVLGCLLGDGSITTRQVNFCSADDDILLEMQNRLPLNHNLVQTKVKIEYRITSDKKCNNISRALKEYNLRGCKSHTKFIPDEYKYSSITQRLEILQGILDTDGHASKRNGLIELTLASKQLINDVQFIVESLGGIGRVHDKYVLYKGEKKLYYRMLIKLPPQFIPFKLNRKIKSFKPVTKYLPNKAIVDIKFVGEKDAQCILIDSEDHLYATDHCILTHNTFSSIFTVECADLFPCLVVVPASVKYNWKMQWEIVNPNIKVNVIDTKKNDWSGDVVIINYDRLANNVEVESKSKSKSDDDLIKKKKIEFKHTELNNIPWKSIICDESQYLKNSKSIRSKAIKKISKKIDYKFFLTGTAIINRPIELVSPLTILGKFDSLFGNWMNFVYAYCDAKDSGFGLNTKGASNLLELNKVLRKNSYVRVEKRDVLTELPDLQETIIEVELENELEYRHAEEDLISYLKTNFSVYRANKASAAKELVLLNVLRQLAVKGKFKSICEQIDLFLESTDKKLVVFGVFTDTLKKLATKYKCDLIAGSVSSEKKQKIVMDFQVNNKRILFGNIKSLGVGVDGLQHCCSDCMFIELPDTHSDISQAISRLERDGQKNNIDARYILAKNSIDIDMLDMVVNKKIITDGVNKGIDTITTDNFIANIMKKYLHK